MNNICQECGMVVRTPTEYHPFAACLMFKACHDGDKVRANLLAVREDAVASFLERTGQYVTNDATREAFRASVLEEAAKVCECSFYDGWDCAHAIRALSGPKGQGSGGA